jgi:ABC-type sugar transport system ATPase subunit
VKRLFTLKGSGRKRPTPSPRRWGADKGDSDAVELAIELIDIVKKYPGVTALDRVSFDAARGEVHAVVGENGAGKSTLLKIIVGATAPDGGSMRIDGEETRPRSPREARRKYGIKMIPQELELCRQLAVGRNVLLGLEGPLVRRSKLSKRERGEIDRAFRLIAARADPRRSSKDITVPEARLAQIAHVLIAHGNVVLCDEPTAVLSETDADAFLDWLVRMRTAGMTIVYISHRLSEVLRIADRITVLRDGRRVGTFTRDEVDRDRMIELMTKSADGGPNLRPPIQLEKRWKGGVLKVSDLSMGRSFRHVSVTVEAGQIVGIAGVQGAGHGALLAAMAGRSEYESGNVTLDGRPVPRGSSAKACRLGIALVPGDRRRAGIAPNLRVRENIALPVTGSLSRFGIRMRGAERASARTHMKTFDIRGAGTETAAGNLSGGNQQKLALAMALEGAPRFLLLEEPTQGIDVGAKAEIREFVERLVRDQGLGALLASSEFEDLLGFADVIHVMRLGRIVATIDGGRATYNNLLQEALP